MKEASGELNLTVVTVVAIAAIFALLYAMWPAIKDSITQAWNPGNDSAYDTEYDS